MVRDSVADRVDAFAELSAERPDAQGGFAALPPRATQMPVPFFRACAARHGSKSPHMSACLTSVKASLRAGSRLKRL